MTRGRLLAGMRARVVNALVESDRGAFERLERHRSGDIRHPGQPFRAKQGESSDTVHCLRSIEESEAFLGLEFHRLETGLTQRFGA